MSNDYLDTLTEEYKQYFNIYSQTRDERTSYNKYFITLLFTDTLFAIFSTLLAANQATQYPGFTRMLLLATLLTAIGISFVWACKLWALKVTGDAQEHAIYLIEGRLHQGAGIKETVVVSEVKKKRSERLGSNIIWHINYWGLPLIFIVVFLFLFVLVAVNPSLFVVPAHITPNASVNASVLA
jgi:hypothetical protein